MKSTDKPLREFCVVQSLIVQFQPVSVRGKLTRHLDSNFTVTAIHERRMGYASVFFKPNAAHLRGRLIGSGLGPAFIGHFGSQERPDALNVGVDPMLSR